MALPGGTRLGPYEILAAIGAGGMGEVYKARDTRLDRDVAVKVLPAEVAADPDLRQRFEREARAVAALQHPHICVLFDVGDAPSPQPSALSPDKIQYLVMEYLDGETLAERLRKGPLPLDQALQVAIQIADALDKAHRHGITHRDLKPGNVMLTKAGAKLLDFGLAKLRPAGTGATTGLSAAPTMSVALTGEGTILGTVQYMAPEQIEGQEADARTDIFAFGVLLYEMLTGRKAFEGKSHASLMGAILKDEPPPMSTLQPLTPSALDRSVRTCLAKDPDNRWQTARDLHRELKWVAERPAEQHHKASEIRRRSPGVRPAWVFGLLICAAAVVLFAWTATRSRVAAPGDVVRSSVALPSGASVTTPRNIALSPDGRVIVFIGQDSAGSRLFMRPIDSFDATVIAGTNGAQAPFFSPDGRWIGFFQSGENKLKKVALSGGAPQTICDTDGILLPAWGDDGTIMFSRNTGTGLLSVSADGGSPRVLTTPDRGASEKSHRGPDILPGGKAVLFTVGTADISSFDDARIEALALPSGQRKVLIRGGMNARYVATGHLIYARAGSLLAVPFDVNRLEVTGAPMALISDVFTQSTEGYAGFAISRSGSLLYVPGGATAGNRSLVRVDRQGRSEAVLEARRPFLFTPRLAPDGRRIAITVDGATAEVWVYDLERTTGARVVYGWDNSNPVWSPDGNELVFNSNRGRAGSFNLFSQSVEGTERARQLTATADVRQVPQSRSPDGRYLVFAQISASGNSDIWVMTVADGTSRPVLQTSAVETNARISPDGRFLAYESDESRRNEVYVQAFPNATRRWQVSLDGGTAPEWAASGRELFYRNGSQMMAVSVAAGSEPLLGRPARLFEGDYLQSSPWVGSAYGVARDGRFVMITNERQTTTHLNLVQNWIEELKRLVPTK